MGMLDTLTSLAAPATASIAERLGESEAAVSRGMSLALASVLGGVTARAQDPATRATTFDLVNNAPAEMDLTSSANISELLAAASTSGTTTNFLYTVFGSRTGAVGDLVTRTADLKKSTSGAALLSFAAPLVLGVLAKKVREEKLDADGLANALAGERESVLAAAPAGLMSTITETPVETRPRPVEERRYAAAAAPTRGGGRRWVWPAVVVAVVIFLWLVGTRRHYERRTVQTSGGEVGSTVRRLGPLVPMTLPNGTRLNVPQHGAEEKLVSFIQDASRPVNDSTWFDLDRLSFATGSATMLPQSKDQISDVVAIMKAYPAVSMKIGGYTDNVGKPAENLKLSQERADSVKSAIVAGGIDANRLKTEGYGETHPIASNSTEAGRAENRRIALNVTAK